MIPLRSSGMAVSAVLLVLGLAAAVMLGIAVQRAVDAADACHPVPSSAAEMGPGSVAP